MRENYSDRIFLLYSKSTCSKNHINYNIIILYTIIWCIYHYRGCRRSRAHTPRAHIPGRYWCPYTALSAFRRCGGWPCTAAALYPFTDRPTDRIRLLPARGRRRPAHNGRVRWRKSTIFGSDPKTVDRATPRLIGRKRSPCGILLCTSPFWWRRRPLSRTRDDPRSRSSTHRLHVGFFVGLGEIYFILFYSKRPRRI